MLRTIFQNVRKKKKKYSHVKQFVTAFFDGRNDSRWSYAVSTSFSFVLWRLMVANEDTDVR